jgi:hypothetical protein
LYDRLLFDPAELRVFIENHADRREPADLTAVINRVLGKSLQGRNE